MTVVISSWADVEALLRDRAPGVSLVIPRGWLEHPKACGLRPTFALPAGQLIDYWKRLDEATGLHVVALPGHYLARLEPVERGAGAAESGARGVALGALIGVALGKTAGAVLVAAAACGIFSAASSSFEEAGAAAPVSPR